MKILLRKSGNDLDRDSELLEFTTANTHLNFEVFITFYLNIDKKIVLQLSTYMIVQKY